ncbi:MAG: hypothetical protein JNM55_03115 [Anaerolineales bacterium]|nr:hypothetical protein [Anaerolineales bacterium]
MRRIVSILLLGFTLASCAPQPAPVPTSTPSTTAAPAHAPEIRFALIGEPTDVNAWQLFDASGASYANYALRSEYWPRLYQLVPPEFNFQPQAAEGMPSAVMQDGDGYSAIIKLRADLKWTDETPFTAEDVAFTVNTSLKYELGYDWASYYSIEYLNRAEAVDPQTLKFYFKQKPNVKVWQYGALQGPILQKAFWESRISQASALLPNEQLASDITYSMDYLASVQARVDDLSAQVNALLAKGQENKSLSGDLAKKQEELNYAKNTLNKLLNERAVEIELAHQALFAVDDANEPTLGTWIPAGEKNGVWINEANPAFPFLQPHFDRAVYKTYSDEESAYSAFPKDEVDVVLNLSGVQQQPAAVSSPNNSKRFLVFNPGSQLLAEINFRKALACVMDPNEVGLFPGGFVTTDAWKSAQAAFLCDGLTKEQRIEKATGFLKSAGYRWGQEPNASQAGSNLKLPDGTEFPRITLLSLPADVDANRAEIATYIEQQALHLGIPLEIQSTDLASLHYAVYSSKKYDMAIFGWQLSEYPGYLCDWFGAGGQFENDGSSLQFKCEALMVESDLEAAQSHVFEIQSILTEELPFISLYSELTYDTFQNVQYPFGQVLGGLSALYGAPSYAIPAK